MARPQQIDPFLVFLAGGVALFLAALALESNRTGDVRTIRLTEAQIASLEAEFRRIQGRAPDADERRQLIDAQATRRALVAHAIELGLHRDDPIVSRRLLERQRMLVAGLEARAPADEALAAYYEQAKEQFAQPPVIAFAHVFTDADLHGEDALTVARQRYAALQATGEAQGDVWYQPPMDRPRALGRIAALMGRPFAKELEMLVPGEWSPPLRSSFGYHSVKVGERTPRRIPPLEEVRELVWARLRAEREAAAYEAFARRVRDRYRLVIEESGT